MRASDEYELLTRDLAERLASFFGVLTTRCERNVRLKGRSTTNQIDVLWEGRIDDQPHRIICECKHYARRVDQGRLHAFRSVVDDVSIDVSTTGVFVTTQGYQSGAVDVATTYDLVVLVVRPPKKQDLAGRLTRINLEITLRTAVIREVNLRVSDETDVGQFEVEGDATWIDFPDGTSRTLRDVLTREECSPVGEPPTPLHRVTRRFEEGTALRASGVQIAGLRAMTAVVGDSDSATTSTIGPGADGIAHIVRDAVTGASAWFEKNGKVRVLDPD